MEYGHIKDNVRKILSELPGDVGLVAAAKTRVRDEVIAAIDAGVGIIGENYVQEALDIKEYLPTGVKMHFIGHLQNNKVKKAVELFDMIETVDSYEIASEIDRRSKEVSKVMPVLVEINSGREIRKHGVFPEGAQRLIQDISVFGNIKVMGLMTMGFLSADTEKVRPLFRQTKDLFDTISSSGIRGVEMRWLSMGMSDSYLTAIEEGANLIRIGTGIFGKRPQKKEF